MYMLYLDLDELPGLGLRSFRRSDYLGDPSRDLATEVRDRVEAALGFRPAGPVRLLTHVRSLGYVFNPVSFYYCFDEGGERLRAVVAEITNTPWGERHAYVLPAGPDGAVVHLRQGLPRLARSSRWSRPTTGASASPGERLEVEMVNLEKGAEVFRARLAMRRTAPSRPPRCGGPRSSSRSWPGRSTPPSTGRPFASG